MGLHLNRISLTLVAQLPPEPFERHLAASPYAVGEALVEQVTAYVRENQLGYYPALDFFQQQGGIEPELLEAVEQIAWFSARLVREEVLRKLRPVFSTVSFQSQQAVAFTMPSVRPSQLNAYNDLLLHYTPDTVKAGLMVTSFQKQDRSEAMTKWAKNSCYRWLKESFDTFEITSAELVK